MQVDHVAYVAIALTSLGITSWVTHLLERRFVEKVSQKPITVTAIRLPTQKLHEIINEPVMIAKQSQADELSVKPKKRGTSSVATSHTRSAKPRASQTCKQSLPASQTRSANCKAAWVQRKLRNEAKSRKGVKMPNVSVSLKKFNVERKAAGGRFCRLGARLKFHKHLGLEGAIRLCLAMNAEGKKHVEITTATGISRSSQRLFIEETHHDQGYLAIVKRWRQEQKKLERKKTAQS